MEGFISRLFSVLILSIQLREVPAKTSVEMARKKKVKKSNKITELAHACFAVFDDLVVPLPRKAAVAMQHQTQERKQ